MPCPYAWERRRAGFGRARAVRKETPLERGVGPAMLSLEVLFHRSYDTIPDPKVKMTDENMAVVPVADASKDSVSATLRGLRQLPSQRSRPELQNRAT